MGKAFGIALVVVGIWVGIEIYTEGMDAAFGGLFQRLGVAEAPAPGAEPGQATSPLNAVRNRVNQDMDLAAAKRKRAMGEEP